METGQRAAELVAMVAKVLMLVKVSLLSSDVNCAICY